MENVEILYEKTCEKCSKFDETKKSKNFLNLIKKYEKRS